MDHLFYKQQIERLKTQWPNAYSEERMVIFYNAFRNVANFDFRDAVDYCLGNSKGAPLLSELNEAISKVVTARKYRERIQSLNPIKELLRNENYQGDPIFMLKCNEARHNLDTKKITQKEFFKIMDEYIKESDEICKKKGTYVDLKETEKQIEELRKQVYGDEKPF